MIKTTSARMLAAGFAVAALSLTSACGGDGGGDRPSQSDIKKAITNKDGVFGGAIPDEAADCVAKSLVDSKLSDKTLNAIVENDKDYKGSDKDKKALQDVQGDLTTCATKAAQ